MKGYCAINAALVEELKSLVGVGNVIYNDHNYAKMPEVIVKPNSAGEIAAILRLVNRELVPATR